MPRPKRKQISFTEDSVNKLLQEIYDDSHNIKATINRLFLKWETRIKEEGNIAAIGDQVVKLIAAHAKNQDQKIMLLRYLKEVVFDKKGEGGSGTTERTDEGNAVSTDRRNELLTFVENEVEKLDKNKN